MDSRGRYIAQCSRIRFCTSCRLYPICNGDRRYIRAMDTERWLKVSSFIGNKPLDKTKP